MPWFPASVVSTAAACRSVLTTWAWVCLAFLVGALLLDSGTALNLVSQLGTDGAGDAGCSPSSRWPSCPTRWCSPAPTSWARASRSACNDRLAGRGHRRRAADVPDARRPARQRATPAWTAWLVVLPPVVAAVGVARAQRSRPTLRYEEAALHGCAGGMLAGAAFGLLAGWPAGSSVRAG